MEFYTLDSNENSSTKFQPTALLEDYESLIWTERYQSAGDFEFISSNIRWAIEKLPLESYVGLRESPVPMIVESHRIEEPKGKGKRVVVKGRSLESVLERRQSIAPPASAELTPPRSGPHKLSADKISDAAYKAIRWILGDIDRGAGAPALDPANALDVIPELNLILPTDFTTGTTQEFEIKPGNLYSVVLEMLGVNHHGIRSIRPTLQGKTTVDIEIYNGADLRETAIFDARYDQFDDAKYLLSHQGSTNVAYVYGPNGVTIQRKSEGAPEPTGLARRVLLLDEMSEAVLNTPSVRRDRGLVELYKNNSIAIFDGEVSLEMLEAKFNKPIEQGGYGLGDIVRFQGNYGLNTDVRVEEFIRTSDSTGEKAYPGFQVVDE